MQFLYPSFLWALAALAIPVIIHLFSFRRFKKVQFSNVRMLQEIKEETSNRSKLKNLLTLLMRLLALAALIFAFAQPYIARQDNIKQGRNAVGVFVDNSYSMTSRQDETPLLDIAKAKAREIISAYSEEDKFNLLTHDFEGRHQRLLTKEDALSLVDEIEATHAVRDLQQVFNRQTQNTSTEGDNQILYMLSDFQNSILPSTEGDAQTMSADTSVELNLLPLQSVIEQNVSIDSVWFDAPVPLLNQNNRLLVKVSNHSSEDIQDIRLSYTKDGESKPEGTFDIAAKDYIIDTINLSILKPGKQNIEFKITDYPVQFDDTYFIAFDVPEKIHVLAIHETKANRYLDAVFRGLNYYELDNQSVSQLKYADFPKYDLILLSDLNNISSGLSNELSQYILDGGNVLCFPGSRALQGNVNAFLQSMASNTLQTWTEESKGTSSINTREFVFSDVFENTRNNLKLPTTKGHFTLTDYQSRGEEKLIRYRDGAGYLVKYKKGAGHFYLCSSPLNNDFNDLVLNAEIFVPLLYKTALSSQNASKIGYNIGSGEAIEVASRPEGDIVYKIQGQETFIPSQTNLGRKVLLDTKDQINNAGFYKLLLGDKNLGSLAYNYDRRESDLSVASTEYLGRLFGDRVNVFDNAQQTDFTQAVGEKDRGIQLWKWFLIACLIFLAIETLLLRFLK